MEIMRGIDTPGGFLSLEMKSSSPSNPVDHIELTFPLACSGTWQRAAHGGILRCCAAGNFHVLSSAVYFQRAHGQHYADAALTSLTTLEIFCMSKLTLKSTINIE